MTVIRACPIDFPVDLAHCYTAGWALDAEKTNKG